MKDGIHIVYCDRPGCGKEVGAQRIENNKVVEEEWVEGHCTYTHTDEQGMTTVQHYCSTECCDKADEFVTPEEVADVQ